MRFTLSRKILGAFLILALLYMGSALFNYSAVSKSKGIIVWNSDVVTPSVHAMDHFSLLTTQAKMYITNWVYLGSNSADKEKLQLLHQQTYPTLKQELSELANQWNSPEQSAKLESVFAEFEQLLEVQAEIMSSLQSFEDYEDPLKVFSAEDRIEVSILPQTDLLMQNLAELSAEKRQEAQEGKRVLASNLSFLSLAFLIIGVAVTLIGIIGGTLISRSIRKPVEYLQAIIAKLGLGELPDKDENYQFPKDEIGEMGMVVYSLVEGLRSTSSFAEQIGKGIYDSAFAPLGENDVLGNSLVQMRSNLISSAEEDVRRNWSVSGQASFAELLQSNQDNLKQLGTKVVAKLVRYLGANQGGIYIVNDDHSSEAYLELLACYAWDREKFKEQKIELGQGLAGQAWQEGQRIYLLDVPQNYVRITSGLGESNPSCVVIQPLMVNDEVYGILELASFQPLDEYALDLLTKVSESIASTISRVRITEHTKALLQQSQVKSEELRAQEEEMRQNQEELQATQEEMERQKIELELEIGALKSRLEVLA